MTKTILFRITLIVTVVMMMLGGAFLTGSTSTLGILLITWGVIGFLCSPLIAQLGKDDENK